MASLRPALVPRAGFSLHARQLSQRWLLPRLRQASSTTPPPKPRVLEKPDKFRPPSHPSRIRAKSRYNYGPDLTQAQKTRRYPHMMPPDGTFLHWFLTNRTIHASISVAILILLVLSIWLSDFLHNTPYADLLPPNSLFLAHPIRFLARWIEVYEMHVAYVSAETAERRKRKVEDVQKRSEYRKAHGLDDESIFGGWTAKTDAESRGPALKEGEHHGSMEGDGGVVVVGHALAGTNPTEPEGEETYVDFEGKRQPLRKKWFGIW